MSGHSPGAKAARRAAFVLVAILVIAGALRLAALLLVGDIPKLHGDEGYYVSAARQMVRGEGYPDSVRPPGLPFFVAGVMTVFGRGLTAVRIAQIGVSLLGVALVFALVRRRFGTTPAALSAALVAIHPELIHYTHFLWTETLVATLLLAAVWALDRWADDPRRRWLVLAGAAVGYGILTREMLLYFVPVVLLWLWRRAGWSVRSTAGPALVFVAAAGAIVLPWTARNYALHGRLVLVSTTRWLPIAQGNVLPKRGSNLALGWSRDVAREYAATTGEIEREEFAKQAALRAIRDEQPAWIFRKLQRNTYLLLTPMTQLSRYAERGWFGEGAGQKRAEALVPLEAWVYVVLLTLGVAALWVVPDERTKLLVVGLLLVHFAIYTVANANHRFRVPLQPFLLMYVGPLLCARGLVPRKAPGRWIGAGASVAIVASIVAVYLVRADGMSVQRKPLKGKRAAPAAVVPRAGKQSAARTGQGSESSRETR